MVILWSIQFINAYDASAANSCHVWLHANNYFITATLTAKNVSVSLSGLMRINRNEAKIESIFVLFEFPLASLLVARAVSQIGAVVVTSAITLVVARVVPVLVISVGLPRVVLYGCIVGLDFSMLNWVYSHSRLCADIAINFHIVIDVTRAIRRWAKRIL